MATLRDNNFNLIRLCAATAVIVSHAYPLALGTGSPEPLQKSLGLSLGTLAVMIFFAISGYFISQSFSRSRSLTEFTAARTLRIFPGLFIVLALTCFVLGLIVTSLPAKAYLTSAGVWTYTPRNLTLRFLQDSLPGVFTHSPYPSAINGSLWTLYYEVLCYVGVVAVGLFGLIKHRRVLVLLALYCVAFAILSRTAVTHAIGEHIWDLSFPFVLGMAYFLVEPRRSIKAIWPFALLGLAAVAWFFGRGHVGDYAAVALAVAGLIFPIGFWKNGLLGLYNKVGDYSYGTYIYAFPIEQLVASTLKHPTPTAVACWSIPLTFGCAIVSWHLVEQPALRCRRPVSAAIEARLRRLSGKAARGADLESAPAPVQSYPAEVDSKTAP